MAGDIDRLMAIAPPRVIAGADDGIRVIGLGLAGRRDEARQRLIEMRRASRIPIFETLDRVPDGVARSARPEMVVSLSAFGGLKIHDDPEAIFQQGWLLCDVGEYTTGLEYLRRRCRRDTSSPRRLRASAIRRAAEGARIPRSWRSRSGRARACRLPCSWWRTADGRVSVA